MQKTVDLIGKLKTRDYKLRKITEKSQHLNENANIWTYHASQMLFITTWNKTPEKFLALKSTIIKESKRTCDQSIRKIL